MFGSLESVDVVVQDPETGRRRFFQTDHRTAEEIRQQEEISILFALTRVLSARGLGTPQEVEVGYVCFEPPPEFLRHAVASAGGTMAVHEGPSLPYHGPLSQPEDLADGAFRRLAERVLRERGAALTESALEDLQFAHAQAPDHEEDEPGYWTRVAELAALAGELLRTKWGGRWIHKPGLAAFPFAFCHPIEGSSRSLISNAVGKAQRFLNGGKHENLLALLDGATDHESSSVHPRPVLLMLKAMDWTGNGEMRCQPLLAQQDPKALVPWLVYGEDLPNSFRYFTKEETRNQAPGELHVRALENLKAIQVEVDENDLLGVPLLAVMGHHYAAEKLVDVDFMRGLHERLGASLLMVGIPRRGLLMAMRARAETSLIQRFLYVCEKQFRRGDFEPISPTPLLVRDGKIAGFAWEEDIRAALSAERTSKPQRGFLSRLFSRKKS